MKQKNRLNYVVFIAPTMVLFLLVFAVPVVVLVGSSFCNWRTGDPITFNGIGNYIELIFHDNSFRQGFLNNVVWILLQGTIHPNLNRAKGYRSLVDFRLLLHQVKNPLCTGEGCQKKVELVRKLV